MLIRGLGQGVGRDKERSMNGTKLRERSCVVSLHSIVTMDNNYEQYLSKS
jgi:hypothetical protein